MNRLLPSIGLLCCAAMSHAASWVPVSNTDGVAYFADPGSLKAEKNDPALVDIQVRADFSKRQIASYDKNLSYQSTVSAYRIDCTNNFIAVLGVSYYAAGQAQGKALKRYTFDKPAQLDIVRWSMFDDLKQYACKNAAIEAAQPARLEDLKPTVIHDERKSSQAPIAK